MAPNKPGRAVGLLYGMGAGLAASGAMDVYWKLVRSTFGERPEQKPRAKTRHIQGDRPSTQVVADEIAEALTGNKVPGRHKAAAGVGIHYLTGLLGGALYGVVAPRRLGPAVAGGLLYGAAIWAILNEAAIRLLKIAPGVEEVPLSQHLQALGAHLVYGATTGLVTNLLLRRK